MPYVLSAIPDTCNLKYTHTTTHSLHNLHTHTTNTPMPLLRSVYGSREYTKEAEDFFEPPGESANAGNDKMEDDTEPESDSDDLDLFRTPALVQMNSWLKLNAGKSPAASSYKDDKMDDTETESSSDEVRPVPRRRRLRRAENSVMEGSSEESDEITVLTDTDESTNIKRKSSEGGSGGEGSSSIYSVRSAAKKPARFEDPPTDDDDAVAAILDTGHQVVKAVGMMNGIRVVTSGLATNASAEQAPVDGVVKVVMSAMAVL